MQTDFNDYRISKGRADLNVRDDFRSNARTDDILVYSDNIYRIHPYYMVCLWPVGAISSY